MCRELETPKAIPHILAGVETLLTSPCPKLDEEAIVSEEKGNGKLPALIAAVWFFVVIKMRGREKQGMETSHRKRAVRDVLERAREDEWMLARVGEKEEAWNGWEVVAEKDVLVWNREINSRGWKELDWFLNVEDGCGVERQVVDVYDVNGDEALEREGA